MDKLRMKLSSAQAKVLCFFQYLDRVEGKTRDGYRHLAQIAYPLASREKALKVAHALVESTLLEESLEHGYRYRLSEIGSQFETGWRVDTNTGELVSG